MKIRHEIANKFRAFSEGKAGTIKGREQSFQETLGHSRASGNPVYARDPRWSLPRATTRGGDDKTVAPSDHRTSWAHHAIHRPQKNITMQQAQRLAQYAPIIQDASRRHGVPVELVCAVILQESGGNAKAVSPVGARGLMQLMPGTARRFGVANSFDPRQNIEGGTKYLRFLMDRFKGDYRLVLAGYNSGEGNVEKYGNNIPPFAETQNYVPNVLAYADTVYQILHTPVVASATLPPHARKV